MLNAGLSHDASEQPELKNLSKSHTEDVACYTFVHLGKVTYARLRY